MKIRLYFSSFISVILLISCHTGMKFTSKDYENYLTEHQKGLIEGDRAPLEVDDLNFLDYFDYGDDYRINAKYISIKDGEHFDMATYSGMTKQYRKIGKLLFVLHSEQQVLYLYQNVKYANHPEYGKYLFLPFKDMSNGMETYGGGRYLDIAKKDLKKNFILDFNMAYNPWCAYSDGYNCPVPPVENHLPVIIEAGEKMYQGSKKK